MGIREMFLHKVSSAGMACHAGLACAEPPALVLIKKNGEKAEYSWMDYKEKVWQAIIGLKGRGLQAEDFVAVIALNLPESFFAMLGAILMDAVPVPINAMLLKEAGRGELKKILDDFKPKLAIGNECLKELLPEGCFPIELILSEGAKTTKTLSLTTEPKNPKAPLIMLYTSGTSGQTKGVMLSEVGVLDRVAAVTREVAAVKEDKILSYLPLGHISELVATFFGQIHSGYTVYFTEDIEETVKDREKFKKEFPKILQRVNPTIFLAVPKIWINFHKAIKNKLDKIPAVLKKFSPVNHWLIQMVKRQLGFSKTRVFISAGSKIEQAEIDFFKKLDIGIDDIYGQTETGGPILINGLPIGNVSVTIGDWSGEIIIQGVCLMLGYYNNPVATAERIKEEIVISEKKSVYRTGDAGTWGKKPIKPTKEGRQPSRPIYFTGRLDDGFKLANGEFISAPRLYELENAIKNIEGVEEAIVCGEGKPFLIALVFTQENYHGLHLEKINKKIEQCLMEAGERLYKVKAFYILNKGDLELTPTMKVKKKAVIKKFQKIIDALADGI